MESYSVFHVSVKRGTFGRLRRAPKGRIQAGILMIPWLSTIEDVCPFLRSMCFFSHKQAFNR
jgi:hypothetical protein